MRIWTLSLLGLILAVLNVSCGPVPDSPMENKKLDDLKTKLDSLQTLLQELNMNKKAEVVNTTPSTSTTPPTESQNHHEQAAEVDKDDDDEVYAFLNKLTPQEVSLLHDVREKLETARQLIITKAISSHNEKEKGNSQPADRSKIEKEDGFGHFKEGSSAEGSKETTTRKPTEMPDKGVFLDKVWSESELGRHEAAEKKPEKNIQTSEGKFGSFRQDFIEDVERRLLSDVKYAKAHGLSLKDITKDFENRVKSAKLSPKPRSTAEVEKEKEDEDLAALHSHPIPPRNM